ncbi:type VII secretion target [Nocardia sp. NPDC023988]|uniref:type VII secretion target n=1 Tax=unclassified Nocardia TaxID=2637762 RepID=UPI0033FA5CEE
MTEPAELSVETSKLNGFSIDLGETAANSSSNASRFHAAIEPPPNSVGLMATVATAVESFRSTYMTAHNSDRVAIDQLGSDLSTTAKAYHSTDDSNAGALGALSSSAFNEDTAAGALDRGHTRYGGLQLPSLQDVADDPKKIRQVVTAAIAQLSPYEESLSIAMGIRPISEFLVPLEADWESIEVIGKRIAMLGINDFVTSENIAGGTRWLRSDWTGSAADSFETTATTLAQSINTRSLDLDAVAKIAENAGICLEQLVLNQAMDMSSRVLETISEGENSFPLGVWAQLINEPLQPGVSSRVTTAVDSLKQAAEARRSAITSLIDKLTQALNYTPGRIPPVFNPADYVAPDKITADPGTRRYGYGSNVWWQEESIDSSAAQISA